MMAFKGLGANFKHPARVSVTVTCPKCETPTIVECDFYMLSRAGVCPCGAVWATTLWTENDEVTVGVMWREGHWTVCPGCSQEQVFVTSGTNVDGRRIQTTRCGCGVSSIDLGLAALLAKDGR